ncbi:MAG: hypothetical protein HUU35_18365, partial [Armatimonadetes bacterium]|nr:hypothetical protein [Armatimonadota bacterium]
MDKSGHEPLTLTSSQETALAVACGLLLLGGLAARGAGASEAAIHLWQGMALAVGSVAPVLSTVP